MLHVRETVLKLFNAETNGWKSVDLDLVKKAIRLSAET